MDPALEELYEAGSGEDEVSVIIRLEDKDRYPPDVLVISRFGEIVTARIKRADIRRIHARDEVASMKAGDSLVEEPGLDEDIEENEAGWEAPHPFGAAGPVPVPEDAAGVVVGICDWGFDFTHANFRNADGTTRLLALWDQSAEGGEPPEPYGYGRVYTRDQIDRALATPDPTSTLGYAPSKSDPRGTGAHGTHVGDIVAGNRREPGSEVGLASAADIVFVHLARQRLHELENFGDSVRLLEGLDFVRRQADESPLVAHFSAGMTGGPHDGTALFAQAVDAFVMERPGLALVQSVGNYAASRMHTHGRIGPDRKKVLHWLISPRDRTPNELEVWYSGQDQFDLTLIAPNGARFVAALGENVKLGQDGTRWGTMYHRKDEPNNGKNHIDIILKTASPSGRYRIELYGRDIVDGRFHAWIERDSGGRHQSHFPRRQATSLYTTNTICNSYRGIATGAYDPTDADRPVTRFSSRGPTADGRQKPELVAPGYKIRAARSLPADGWKGEERLTAKSGTSMAAPFVTGTVALMMQAAGRPLSIVEIRRILVGTADPPPGRSGRSSTSLGYGYLNTVAAVEAARRIGRRGSPEAEVIATRDESRDHSAEWAPRWVTDQQPFEHAAVEAYAMDSENAYDRTADTEKSAVSEGDGHSFEVEEHHVRVEAGDDQRYDQTDNDDIATAHADAPGPGDEADEIIFENAMAPEDGTDLDAVDETDDEMITDDMNPQEEEEGEAYRLTALYEALGELATEDLREG